jgi:replicative DNA helicase
MVDPSYWENVSLNLTIEDFYKKEHIYIFTAMLNLVLEQKQIDIITISEHLEIKNNLTNAGGLFYLSEITNNIQTTTNIDIYIEIIKRKSKLRKLLQIGNDLTNYCYTPGEKTLTELLSEIEYKLQKVIEIKKADVLQTPISIAKIFKRTIRTIDKLAETKNSVTGLPTGFFELDKLTSGLQPANLIILAGRPSMGKTTLALNIAEHILLNTKKSIIFFSMEMQAEQLAIKLLASLSRINIQNLSTGKINNEDWKKLSTNISLITAKKLFIDDAGSLNPMEVRSKIQKTIRKNGKTSLIIIDYLQLMKIPSTKETRTTEISEITRSLKTLAKELNIPILVLSK